VGIRCISDAIVSCTLEIAKEVLDSLPMGQTRVGVESSKIAGMKDINRVKVKVLNGFHG